MVKKDIVRLHSGSIIEIEALRDFLEKNNISTLTREQFQEGLNAGFPDGTPGLVDLFVLEEDYEVAIKLFADYKK